MAGIIPLPPIHLSQRAVEWLTKSTVIVPSHYNAHVGWAACWLPGTAFAQKLEPSGDTSLGHTTAKSRMDPTKVIALTYSGEMQPPDPDKPNAPPKPQLVATMTEPLSAEWLCGVSDVRALWLASALAQPGETDKEREARRYGVRLAKVKKGPDIHWARRPIQMPTCPECRVELDKALEMAVNKAGKYRDVSPSGQVIWREYPLRSRPPHGPLGSYNVTIAEEAGLGE